MIVPVHLEFTADAPQPGGGTGPGMRAECTRCGHACAVRDRRKAAETREAALEKLADECPHAGECVRHVDRVIPRGCTLWYVFPGDGKRYPLAVAGRAAHGAMGAVKPAAAVRVLPRTRADEDAARDFAGKLRKWGYQDVEVLPPEVREPAAKKKVK